MLRKLEVYMKVSIISCFEFVFLTLALLITKFYGSSPH
jgi:hypothetical protein